MGCWYATCGVSNTPIMDGDEVVVFLLNRKCDKDLKGIGYGSPNDLFNVVNIPIFAKYRDNGTITDVEDINKEEVLSKIKHKLDYYVYKCDVELDIDTLTLEDVFYLINKEAIYTTMFDNRLDMGVMLVHKRVYNSLLEDIKKDEFIVKRVEDAFKLCLEDVIRKKDMVLILFDSDLSFCPSLATYVTNHYSDDRVCNEVKNVMYFDFVLRNLRKGWIPQSGVGSQELVNSSYKVLVDNLNYFINREDLVNKDAMCEDSKVSEDSEECWVRSNLSVPQSDECQYITTIKDVYRVGMDVLHNLNVLDNDTYKAICYESAKHKVDLNDVLKLLEDAKVKLDTKVEL